MYFINTKYHFGIFHECVFLVYKKSLQDTKDGNQKPYNAEGQTTQWPKEKTPKSQIKNKTKKQKAKTKKYTEN